MFLHVSLFKRNISGGSDLFPLHFYSHFYMTEASAVIFRLCVVKSRNTCQCFARQKMHLLEMWASFDDATADE